jgi:hypothetical protein
MELWKEANASDIFVIIAFCVDRDT